MGIRAFIAKAFNKKSMGDNKKKSGTTEHRTFKIVPVYEDSRLSFANVQHIGKREEQQDSFAVSDIKNVDLYREKGVFAIVADGMGGLENGRESSNLVVSSMIHYFTEKPFLSAVPIELRNMVVQTNDDLLDYLAKNSNSLSGSTLAAVIIKDYRLFWISVGDSRIYLYRGNRLYSLNRDHAYGTDLINEVIDGKMTLEEALSHPDRRALTSYMGIMELKEIDQNISPFELLHGDKIILCSDGIYGSLDETEMINAMELDTQQTAVELEQSVLRKEFKNQDNMTAIIIGLN